MHKYIHYCWFGNNKIPRLAKKCIKSWKRYLPDYEIKKWDESNFDINECPFIKEAYEQKKWAFVADYVRTKVLYEYGGIYFDTDMYLKKNIDFLLDKPTFLGVEDSNMVACGVWGAKEPKSSFSKEMLDFYQNQNHFNIEDLYSISIPRIMTGILNKYNFDFKCKNIQILNNDIYIYPREYFYPLSYNYRNNKFTKNTCMIHYYDASWIPKWEQRENAIFRIMGYKYGKKFIAICRKIKKLIKFILRIIFFPIYFLKNKKNLYDAKYKDTIKNTKQSIVDIKNDYITLVNTNWLGVTNATKELFDNIIHCEEIKRKKDINTIVDCINNNSNIHQVIFSGMCEGWNQLAIKLKETNPSIKIKVFWHGNNSQVFEPYGWKQNLEIIRLNKQKIIDIIGTCKKSIIPFYEKIGLKTVFISNCVSLKKINKREKNNSKIRIGIYAAKSNDWRKNIFAQIAAVAMLNEKVILDIAPLNNEIIRFANYFGINVEGIKNNLPRKDLIERMSNNDVNLYVTFSECSPMLPLESFEAGTPCITGNNHHFFRGELEEFLIVNNEENAIEIKEKIEKVLKNKDKIINLYQEWSSKNKKESKRQVKNFLEM